MSEINESLIEAPLKALLEEVLYSLESYLECSSDLKFIEYQLKDYDTLPGLVKIISNVFKTLMKKVEKRIAQLKLGGDSYYSYRPEEEYEKLELIIQKHEAEIRNHISIEQQLKLYNESLQQKIEDLEKQHKESVDSFQKQITVLSDFTQMLKKDLGKSTESYRQLIKQNETLRESVEQLPKAIVHTEGEVRVKEKKQKKVDYSSEYPASLANFYPQNSMRHSTPLKSQSQHHKSGKLNSHTHHRHSQEQDLFVKYNQLLKQHAQSISQRSQIIQASQYLLKGGFSNNKKQRNTLNTLNGINDLGNSQKQRNKSQGNSSRAAPTNSQNNINASNKSTSQKIISETCKTNEAIQRLLKLK